MAGVEKAKSISPKVDYVDLHELSKGWKAAVARVQDPNFRHEAKVKNDRGNLPLHSAASFRAPLEVAESLLDAYPEAARESNNYGNLALHFTAWKKGPLDVEKLLLRIYPEGAAQKNNHGNLPLHYAAHYNAPLEVVEALYNAFPEGAQQNNNDNNTPLDLAIADGASPNVIALLQGKSVPPSEEELLTAAKSRVDRAEKELQGIMERHDGAREDLAEVLDLLMAIRVGHSHALFSAGIDPVGVGEDDLEALLKKSREASQVQASRSGEQKQVDDDDADAVVVPLDDVVENALAALAGMDALKCQVRGMRRTLELNDVLGKKLSGNDLSDKTRAIQFSPHMAFVGGPGTGKTSVARTLGRDVLYKIGAVEEELFIELGRDDLVDKTMARTIRKTRAVIEKARGGVLFIDEAYTLLPSPARKNDHGVTALAEIGKILHKGDPYVILAGYSGDLQKLMATDLGFKGNFMLQIEFPDYSVGEIATMFFDKALSKGYVFEQQVTVDYVLGLVQKQFDEEYLMERNGRVADMLLSAVRFELKKRLKGMDEPSPMKGKSPRQLGGTASEEITITAGDVQSAISKM